MPSLVKHAAILLSAFLFLTACTADNIHWSAQGNHRSDATTPSANIIRINFGRAEPYKDSAGNLWLGDTGMADGDIVDRGPEQAIKNTKDPDLFRTEHWGMTEFSYPVPNGKYVVKLYFAETSDHVSEPGQRVFDMNVLGNQIKDFDPLARAGGFATPFILEIPVTITTGKLDITFTVTTEQSEINALEIIPQ